MRCRPLLVLVAFGSCLSLALGGDLTPPASPVGPTMKPLAEVEPRIALSDANTPGDADSLYVIEKSGSYYLTGNLTPVGKSAVTIIADDVTLDLNGFSIDGSAAGARSGIQTSGVLSAIRVHNGSVHHWQSTGVFLGSAWGVVENLRVHECASNGVQVGDRSVVRSCTLLYNSGDSIRTTSTCTIVDCTIVSTGASAITTGSGSTVRNNSIRVESATTNGIIGLSFFTSITDNNVTANTGAIGIKANSSSFVARNTVAANFGTPLDLNPTAKYGPIIYAAGDLSTVPNANHPWANFVY